MEKKEYTEQQLADWAEDQKHRYQLGLLKISQIKKLEAIPGWTWEPAKKEQK